MSEYRQGHFAGAIEWSENTVLLGEQPWQLCRRVGASMVLAMAHYRMQHLPEARAALAQGEELADRRLPRLESGDIGGQWRDWIIARALMTEAKALLQGTPAEASEKQKRK